jgi:anti-anti-sigma regulatory factor
MAAFNISVSADDSTVTVQVSGVLDLSTGFAFWQYCQPEVRRGRAYVFDLVEVSDLRDSGLGWLLSFLHRARGSDMHVNFIRARSDVARRLREVGIDAADSSALAGSRVSEPEGHTKRAEGSP